MNSFTHSADKSRATVVTMSWNKKAGQPATLECLSSALYLDHWYNRFGWKVKHNPVGQLVFVSGQFYLLCYIYSSKYCVTWRGHGRVRQHTWGTRSTCRILVPSAVTVIKKKKKKLLHLLQTPNDWMSADQNIWLVGQLTRNSNNFSLRSDAVTDICRQRLHR